MEVLSTCNEMCLATYHKPVQTYETGETALTESEWEKEVSRSLGLLLSPVQKTIFLSLYYWRDVVAREWGPPFLMRRRLDESVQFILPLLHILRVVDTQPQTVEALKLALSPMSEVVAQRIDRLMSIVKQCASAKATDKNMYVCVL